MLKAGTQTGSLVNHLYSRGTRGQPEPVVGMGATILLWTDRHAATIVEVSKDKQGRTIIGVQEDDAKRTDSNGFSESQTYDYTRNTRSPVRYWRLNDKGFWEAIRKNEETGRWNKFDGNGIKIGVREQYWDPSF
jgi:hypothetical protein